MSLVSPRLVLAALVATNAVGCASTEQRSEASVASRDSVDQTQAERFMYPKTRKAEQLDVYHGTTVKDPYRWLEDPDADETRAWVEAQNRLTFGHLGQLPVREALKERLTKLWNYERYSPPFREGDRWFYFKNDGLQNQSVLYQLDRLEAAPKVLLDPNQWSAEGTTALASYSFSDDGKFLAFAKSEGGSDWHTWHVVDIETGKELPDVLRWSKFSGASFTHDNAGFFYSRYPEPSKGDELESANYFHKVYYHRLGTPQEQDVLVFEDNEHKTRGFDAQVTEDGDYVVIHVWEGTDRRNRLYYLPLGKGGSFDSRAQVVRLLDGFDASYEFVGNDGKLFYVKTDKDAPRGKLLGISLDKPAPSSWTTLLAEREDKLEGVAMRGGGLLAFWLHNAHDKVTFHKKSGDEVREVGLPVIGNVSGFSGRSTDNEVFYALTSFTYPSTIFHLDLKTGASTEYRRAKVDFEPDAYETRQVFFTSKDGTQVPMFLVHKKGIEPTGDHPTYLYGYGGFNISLQPTFSVPIVAWLEQGGVYAQPSLRGGGEFGETWHEAGMLEKKQTVFDDFASAAEWLIQNGITQSSRLAIGGGSNGGLLVGASITQRPDLFGAAVAQVGVLDMLRFHRFTIGHAWVSEYGSADDPKMFDVLHGYSPLHNVKAGQRYPATLITTADHDDRVVPAHSFKFAATLQEAQAAGGPPVMIRIDTKAGHGAGKSTTKQIEEVADRYAFVLHALGAAPKP